jgi:hypothetical protein
MKTGGSRLGRLVPVIGADQQGLTLMMRPGHRPLPPPGHAGRLARETSRGPVWLVVA